MYWPGEDAVGKRFKHRLNPNSYTVIGVAQDAKYGGLGAAEQPHPIASRIEADARRCVVVGLATAFGATRLIASLLFVSPTDARTFSAISALLAVVAMVASLLPARRAARVDPLVALRREC